MILSQIVLVWFGVFTLVSTSLAVLLPQTLTLKSVQGQNTRDSRSVPIRYVVGTRFHIAP